MAKSQKLSQSRKLKSEKLKKLSKSGNLLNFNAIKAKPSFLIPNIKTIFNYLRLTFIKAQIFCYFNLAYHIWIETDTLGYVISGVLNQLIFGTSPDKVVIKTNLGQ